MPTLHEPRKQTDSGVALAPPAPGMRMPSTIAPLPRIEQIDVLRGLASLWVLFSHYQPYWNGNFAPTTIIVPNSVGVHAVELFFVISGFVIFMTLERCRTVLDFVVLRASRLYPVYWTALLLGTAAGIVVFGGPFWAGGLLANLTMFQEFLGYRHFDVVFWSLSIELAFYLNVTAVFALGLHRYPKAIVAVWLLATCIWALLGGALNLDREHRPWLVVLFVLDYAPYFSMGIIFFHVTKSGWSGGAKALFALAAIAELLTRGWETTGIALFIAFLFWLALKGHLAFLVSRVTVGLGAISYALYVSHRNLGYQSLNWLHAHNVEASVAIPLVIIGAITLATLITYGIEKPALTAIRRWHHSRGAQHVETSPAHVTGTRGASPMHRRRPGTANVRGAGRRHDPSADRRLEGR